MAENGINGSGKSLNTILLWVTLAALAFIGTTSFSNAVALARLEGAQMGRQEIETKLAEIRQKELQLEGQLVSLTILVSKTTHP